MTDSNTPKDGKIDASPFEPIKPAQVPLTATANNPYDNQPVSIWRQHPWLIIAFPLTLALLLVVIFVLPANIDPVSNSPTSDINTTANTNTTPPLADRGPTESPWADAQFAKERRETQDILAKLVDIQEQLEAIKVEQWNPDTFSAAAEKAAQADVFYRDQNFQQSKQLYSEALQTFNQLLDESEQVYRDSLDHGNQAIDAGDSATAIEHFTLAASIHPELSEAQSGLERAQVLDNVLALVKQGERDQRQGNLDAAKQQFQQALQLDNQYTRASDNLASVNQAIKNRNYGRAMSEGFAALNSGNFSDAISAFRRALTIKPGADDAEAALKQAQNQNTQVAIQQLLAEAQKAEAEEQWQTAADNYNQALELDANVVQAKVGAIQATTRAEMDRRFVEILEEPQRLSSTEVFREYQKLGRDAQQIADAGPRLQQQLKELEQAMHRAIAPVTVQLKSDNMTNVTVYKVGSIGRFTDHELTLKPGQYTAVGTREGYRDVREEFTVSVNDSRQKTIVIQCAEKISKG